MKEFEIFEKFELDWSENGFSQIYPLSEGSSITHSHKNKEHFILKFSNNQTEIIKIENAVFSDFETMHLRLIKIDENFALLNNLKRLHFLSPNFQIDKIVEIETPKSNQYENFASSYDIGIGENNTLPVILSNGHDNNYHCFGFLKYDKFSNKAKVENVFSLETSSFPVTRSNKLPFIKHLLLKKSNLYIYVEGSQDTKYLGQNYSCLLFTDLKGNLKKQIFLENYEVLNDQKKRGKIGKFTFSSNYTIISPLYNKIKYDSWNGRQKVYSITEDCFFDFKLPKGFSNLKLIDHFNDKFWFEGFDKITLIKTLFTAKEKLHTT